MTTIISRFFDTASEARAVRFELIHRQRLPLKIVGLFEETDGLVPALIRTHVGPDTAAEYERRVAHGGAVLVVRARYKPLGVAQITRDVFAQSGSQPLDGFTEEVLIKDKSVQDLSILPDHPLFLTRPRDPLSTNYHMADWPIGLISRRKPFAESLFPPHARMANWPIPLLYDRKPYTKSIFPRHARMANFPIPLLSKRKPFTGSIFPRHARMANFPIPLISRRKPFNRSLFPRHQRMATWPFPLLINGKTGTNALIPGAPRMANFPIPLLSGRKPFTGSIIPRHARMANFPIPLLSRRKPFAKSAIKPHVRMADLFLPLTVPHGEARSSRGSGFSFSKLLKIPTLIQR